jgi:hypothetical protein
MNILTSAVPQWVSILFLMSILVAILMIAHVAKQGASNKKTANNIFAGVLGFYVFYFVYVGFMSFTGIFQEVSLPPKIFFYTTIPLFLFLNFIIARTAIFKATFKNICLKSLVVVHTFRFIGIFFLITNAYGAIPTQFAYIAGIGDITTAILSFFVAHSISTQKKYAKKFTFIWNIFGFCDILSVIVSGIVTTKQSIETGSLGVTEIANFPFCLIPAFAPATILFLHLLIFRKLWMERK